MANSGIFNTNEILELQQNRQFPIKGSYDLIQTQTITNSQSTLVSRLQFSELQEDEYNTHLIQVTNLKVNDVLTSGYQFGFRAQSNNVNAGGWKWGQERHQNGSTSDQRSTSYSRFGMIWFSIDGATENSGNGYIYIHNAGNPTVYTSVTAHFVGWQYQNTLGFNWGGGVMPTASKVDAFEIANYSNTIGFSGTFSLYGLRDY